MKLRLPNLLIAGAAKSGTTSLYHYLDAHPQCGMSNPKETYFFTNEYSADDVERYSMHFADVPSSATVVGEASPTYLSVPSAAERIRAVLGPDVRLVFLLRNPVDRAVSAFCHVQKRASDLRRVGEALLLPTENLDDAIRLEQSGIVEARRQKQVDVSPYESRHDDPEWNFRYLRNSSYVTDLRRFERIFGRHRMLILLTEELRQEPIASFQRVARFLEIDPTILPANLHRHYNRTLLPKPGITTRLIRTAARRLPERYRLRQRILESTFQQKPSLGDAGRRQLTDLFRAHNRTLRDEFGLNVDRFWGPLQFAGLASR